ncbi:MAG: RpiB/LacA/LacB family sugar-phosphate isomerase [bacterium]|nr:RpiB/LacA/LacB family sugar-phosphate isomerase [bacterium]
MIHIGSDHRGFQLKRDLYDYLVKKGYQVSDLGTDSEEPIDYPVIAEKVGRKVKEDPNNRGIVICGSGVGVCIVANKIDGIRAAQAWDPEVAKAARNDDNINVLCLSADYTETEAAEKITQKFLDTSFGGAERFNRRIKEITDLEKDN